MSLGSLGILVYVTVAVLMPHAIGNWAGLGAENPETWDLATCNRHFEVYM